MKNLYLDAVKCLWFLVMAGLVCFGLFVCALGAMVAGASFKDACKATQENFNNFVEGWKR